MASLLELGVSTGKWDSGLKKAQSALNNFTQSQGGLQQALDKENQKIGQFVQMMGKMESTAKTAKGQMSDYKGSIEQLSAAYNRMTDAQRQTIGQNYLQAIDAMKKKFQEAKQSVDDLNRSLNDTGNAKLPDIGGGGIGGLFGGGKLDGMLQVFGGNLMTKGAGMLAGFASEMQDLIQQGIELAKQGEGIRIAFERLNQPGILDNLREATHGTVTDIELMKAAVKFNDFKLPVEELGTMLAFAQQKAKDTGQSIDYMVDSIVTGLGRKSLMILDNLGLSAAEIKEKMAETGDMTKAVGAIIREQMQQAGDYVETAADRATKADVELKNAMEELGRTFQPLTESGTNMFNALKIGAINALNALRPYIDALTTAGRARQAFENKGGNTEVDKQVGRLRVIQANGNQSYFDRTYNNQLADYDKQINDLQSQIDQARKSAKTQIGGTSGSAVYTNIINDLAAQQDALRKMRDEYVKGAKELMNPVKPKIDTKEAISSVDELKVKLAELEAQRKKAIQAGDRDQIKNLTQQINQTKQDIKGLDPQALKTTTTHKATPQERAQSKVDAALQDYAATIKKADLRMEAGLDSTLDHKKKELSAQERLYDAYTDAYAIYKNPAYKEASEKAASEITRLSGEVKDAADAQEAIKKAARELESAQKKLADAQSKLADAQATGSSTAIYKAQENVRKQEAVVDRLRNPNAPAQAQPTGFAALRQSIQGELKFDQMKVDETTLRTLLSTAIKNGLDEVTVDYNRIQEKIAKGIDIPESTWKELQDEINAKLAELGIEPIKIDFSTGKMASDAKKVTGEWQSAASAIQAVGSAMSQIEDPAAKVLGTIAQAIATVALTFATSLKGTVTPWDWIAAAAAGTATMISTISAIHAATGYSEGGMIKGNSYSNDRIMATNGSELIGLNAGEIVLNRAQQGNLAAQLNGAGGGGDGLSGQPFVTGDKIFLGINNSLKAQGKGEIVTTSMLRRMGIA